MPLSTKAARHIHRNHTGELGSTTEQEWAGRGVVALPGQGVASRPPRMLRLEKCAKVEMQLEIEIGSTGLWGQLQERKPDASDTRNALALLAPSCPTVKLELTGVYRGTGWFCQVVVRWALSLRTELGSWRSLL